MRPTCSCSGATSAGSELTWSSPRSVSISRRAASSARAPGSGSSGGTSGAYQARDAAVRRAASLLDLERLQPGVEQLAAALRAALDSGLPEASGLLDALGASIAIPGVTVTFAHKLETHGWCLDGGPEVPDDDRPGVHTVRVGVGPRLPRTKPDHIAPSRPIGFEQRVLLLPRERRRELFHLGYADARRHLEAA